MTEIHGIGENWAPNKLVVANSGTNNGEYNYLDRGGGGIVYVNGDINKVIKIIPNVDSAKKELRIHRQMGNLAPTLYFYSSSSSSGQVIMDKVKTKHFFDGDSIFILIMEYLNPEEWNPINNIPQLVQYHSELFDFIYELIFSKGYRNLLDFVGMTGPHLFINDDEEIKILDFGAYKPVEDKKKDFLLMIEKLQDNIMILHPSEEDLDCYKKIMNLATNLEEIDEICKQYFLYMGREFLEDRLPTEIKSKRRKTLLGEESRILSAKKKNKPKKTKKKNKPKRKNNKSKRKDRKGPSESATKFKIGTIKKGNDNNMWKIVVNKKGIQRWVKLNKG